MTYYDSTTSAIKYAITDGTTWYKKVIASAGVQGLYANLSYDAKGIASIFYFDKTHNRAVRAKGTFKSVTYSNLGAGGRCMQVARRSTGSLAWTNLNEAGPNLTVGFLAS